MAPLPGLASPAIATYADVENRSPWIAQLAPDPPRDPLAADLDADLVVIGAGIAGVATTFFALADTSASVLLLERDRVGRGATGRNAGQLTTYFERPLTSIAAEFGDGLAADGQAAFNGAHALLDRLIAESGASVRVERFAGRMGMFALPQLLVHLRCQAIRRAGGVPEEEVVVSEEAPYLADLPADFAPYYRVVPQAEIRALLELADDRYTAVLSAPAGCANSGLLVQQVLAAARDRWPERLRYHDGTHVDRVVVRDDGSLVVHALGHTVSARRLVLCTNGFVEHEVVDQRGEPVLLHPDQRVVGRVAYMAAFHEVVPRSPASMSYIRNVEIGGDVPYVYVTRRTYDLPGGVTSTLTCMGGPEYPTADGEWRADAPFPGSMLALLDAEVRPFGQPARGPGEPYDFAWHGLMGYMGGGVRVVGAHPAHRSLLYNLGCNGVGFLPSIAGAARIARLLAGEPLPPSIFDPREPERVPPR